MTYVGVEVVVAIVLLRYLVARFRSQPEPVKGLLVTVAISFVLFVGFSLLVPDCALWRAPNPISSLYGTEVQACFPSAKQRLALSTVLAFVYSSLVAVVIVVLTSRSTRSRAKTRAPG